MFDLPHDPLELSSVLGTRPELAAALERDLARMSTAVNRQRDKQQSSEELLELDNDAQLQQRLRGLGYLE